MPILVAVLVKSTYRLVHLYLFMIIENSTAYTDDASSYDLQHRRMEAHCADQTKPKLSSQYARIK